MKATKSSKEELAISEKTNPEDEGLTLSFFSGLSLFKSVIGGGIVSIPIIASEFGYMMGVFLLLVAAIASCFGLYLYAYGASALGRKSSPYSLVMITYPRMGLALDFCIAAKCIGVALTYMMLCGSITSKLVSGSSTGIWCSERLWTCVYTIFIIGPLSFLRKIDQLKYSSFLGILASFYLVFLSIYAYFDTPPADLPGPEFVVAFKRISLSSIAAFASAVFAFTCHQNIFPIHNETKDNSVNSLLKMCVIVISAAFGLYLVFISFSYLTFAEKMSIKSEPMLTYYPTEKTPYQLARLLFAVLISMSYPLQVLPFRISASNIIFRFRKKENSEISPRMHVYLTSFILGVNFVIAMFKPKFDLVMNLIGSLTSSPICYIFPAMFYLKLTEKEGWTKLRVAALFLGILGLFVSISCTGSSLYKISVAALARLREVSSVK